MFRIRRWYDFCYWKLRKILIIIIKKNKQIMKIMCIQVFIGWCAIISMTSIWNLNFYLDCYSSWFKILIYQRRSQNICLLTGIYLNGTEKNTNHSENRLMHRIKILCINLKKIQRITKYGPRSRSNNFTIFNL